MLIYYSCILYLTLDDTVILLSTLMVQCILQMRIYAIWKCDRRILRFMVVATLLEVISMAILIIVTMVRISGCSYSGLIHTSALFWTPALVFEPLLCGLMLIQTRPLQDIFWLIKPRSLPALLGRDSLLYCVVIFSELLVTTNIWIHAPEYMNIVNPWSIALPSILGSRLLLHLKEYAPEVKTMTLAMNDTQPYSALVFNGSKQLKGIGSNPTYDAQAVVISPGLKTVV